MTTMPPHDSYEPGSAEEVLMNAAAALDLPDLDTVDWSTLTRAETKAVMAARRLTPESKAKADKLAAAPPASAAARRRWRANQGRQTPPPNMNLAVRDALDPVTYAAGSALHAGGTLAELEAAEDAAIEALARDVEARELEDLEQALSDKRAARVALLAQERAQLARIAQAQADARAADEALTEALTAAGYGPTTPIINVYPLSVRHQIQDLAHKATRSTQTVNQLMTSGIGTVVGFDENIRQSTALLRQIAAHRASESRTR